MKVRVKPAQAKVDAAAAVPAKGSEPAKAAVEAKEFQPGRTLVAGNWKFEGEEFEIKSLEELGDQANTVMEVVEPAQDKKNKKTGETAPVEG